MKTKAGPAIVGAFVIGAFVLAIIALLSFGGISFFSKPERFMVNFDESIHGLDLGSPVKLRGVRIGRVVELNVQYTPEKNGSMVSVVCELNRDIITDSRGIKVDVSSAAGNPGTRHWHAVCGARFCGSYRVPCTTAGGPAPLLGGPGYAIGDFGIPGEPHGDSE
jgi:hypothetical protein